MSWYRTGTIAVANGSTAVTGTGTAFVGAVSVGWGLAGPDGRVYEIVSVTSATVLTLGTAYQGSTASGQTYAAFPTRDLGTLPDQLQAVISAMQATIDGAGAGKFADGTVATPGLRFAADADTGLYRPAANKIGLAAGGVQRALLSGTTLNVSVPITGTAITQSTADATAGRLLKVGDFGLGAITSPVLANLDDFTTLSGVYEVDGSTVTGTKPATTTTGDAVLVLRPNTNQQTQIYSNPNNGLTYIRKSNASASWGPWRLIYESGNLLGTVSQTAGAPTGAVIERGANANGEYVKFADGTLICTTSGITLVYSTADLINYTWTFPAPCVVGSFPVVSAALSPLTADYAGLARRDLCAFAQSAGTAGAVVSFTRPSGATRAFIAGDAAANVRLVVTGRWF